MLTGYSEGIRSEEKEENGQKVNVNLVYCLRFTVYSFLRSVGAQASKLGVLLTVYSLFILLKVYEIFSDFLLGEQSLNFGLLRKEIYQKSIQNLIMFRNDIFKGHTDSTEITDYFVSTLITINRPLIYHQFIYEHG